MTEPSGARTPAPRPSRPPWWWQGLVTVLVCLIGTVQINVDAGPLPFFG